MYLPNPIPKAWVQGSMDRPCNEMEGGMGVIPPGQFIGNAADKDSHAITTGWAEIDEKPRRLRSMKIASPNERPAKAVTERSILYFGSNSIVKSRVLKGC